MTQFELQQEQLKASQQIAEQLENVTYAINSLELSLTTMHGPTNWTPLEAIVELAAAQANKQ